MKGSPVLKRRELLKVNQRRLLELARANLQQAVSRHGALETRLRLLGPEQPCHQEENRQRQNAQ